MAVAKREEALRRWSRERTFVLVRMVFLFVKVLSSYVFYSMVTPLGTSDEFHAFYVLLKIDLTLLFLFVSSMFFPSTEF